MNDAPAILFASEDPGRSDLKQRLLRTAWDLKTHSLKLYDVPEVPLYVRRNPLDRQGPLGVLRARPVESWRDLVPTVLTLPAQDAEERDVGGASKESFEGLRTPSK